MHCNLSSATATFCDIKYDVFSCRYYVCQLLCYLILFDLLTWRDRSAKLAKRRLAHREARSINRTACDEQTEIPPISCRILTNGLIVDRLCRNAFSQQRATNPYCEENLYEISTPRNLNSNESWLVPRSFCRAFTMIDRKWSIPTCIKRCFASL